MSSSFPMVRDVPYMGVIWVVHEASKLGFWNGHPDWCNLGQGQPEVGDMPGAPARINHIDIDPADHAYGPVGGTGEVREAIADMVNRTYRRGKSKYTADNVSFASGGRLALTRLYTILADGARIAYKNPDYTAYEDYLYSLRNRCVLLPIRASEQDAFSIPAETLENFIHQERANVFVFSNPCNPTGELISGETLESYVATARRENCLIGSDEFYSHFIYNEDGSPANGPVSAAEFVEDVDRDPVVIFDGLTKSHRYPGWRAGWAVGPKHIIEMLNRAASAVDGGPSMLSQRATLAALEPSRVEQETTALRAEFAYKRRLMLDGLAKIGIRPAAEPRGTFYVWACIRDLPAPLNDADAFFHACLSRKVMTVPGRFFDVRPYRTRPAEEPYRSWVRFSYGPSRDVVKTGIERISALVREYR
ncbi:pyridoxal phosphate-dependent aminotransferase [uncultured Mailhella sp.]|uniref:pyridoxal phosphate-dependent aminotransferase n=1 Tax=uncultured Mailhella sp. TaxID=1981031 RepID=UPI0025D72389|nr:pyridoxal phosphate-dependent aminotransferase [uncultured Mailhella sp.]